MVSVLIIHDTAPTRSRLTTIVQDAAPDLEVVPVGERDKGESLFIERSQQGCPFGIVIVDLYLQDPPVFDAPEGVRLLKKFAAACPDAYRILVSARKLNLIPHGDYADKCVSMHYENRNYVAELQDCIRDVVARIAW